MFCSCNHNPACAALRCVVDLKRLTGRNRPFKEPVTAYCTCLGFIGATLGFLTEVHAGMSFWTATGFRSPSLCLYYLLISGAGRGHEEQGKAFPYVSDAHHYSKYCTTQNAPSITPSTLPSDIFQAGFTVEACDMLR